MGILDFFRRKSSKNNEQPRVEQNEELLEILEEVKKNVAHLCENEEYGTTYRESEISLALEECQKRISELAPKNQLHTIKYYDLDENVTSLSLSDDSKDTYPEKDNLIKKIREINDSLSDKITSSNDDYFQFIKYRNYIIQNSLFLDFLEGKTSALYVSTVQQLREAKYKDILDRRKKRIEEDERQIKEMERINREYEIALEASKALDEELQEKYRSR